MRRLVRRAFNFISATSLVVAIVACAVWTRSYFVEDTLTFNNSTRRAASDTERQFVLASACGGVEVMCYSGGSAFDQRTLDSLENEAQRVIGVPAQRLTWERREAIA